jgi:TonB family protein
MAPAVNHPSRWIPKSVIAMSIAQFDANYSTSEFERRRHVRQRVNDLAYLEIGAGNGGIVLNLSGEGMGIQAAVPLSNQTEVNLRMLLPHSRARLEIAAEIIWFAPGNQQAGVRFVSMSSETRVQIHEWIRAQLSPRRPSQETTPQMNEVSNFPRKRDPVPASREDKWSRLMGELEEQRRLLKSQLSTESSEAPGDGGLVTQEKRPPLMAQRKELNNSSFQEIPIRGTPPKESTIEQAPNRLGIEVPPRVPNTQRDAGDSGDSAITSKNYEKPNHRELIEWPNQRLKRVPSAVPGDESMHSVSRGASINPPAFKDEAKTNDAATTASTLPPLPAPARSTWARGWVALAILLTSVCVLFFGIGTWVGRPISQPSSVQPTLETTVAVPASESAPKLNIQGNSSESPAIKSQTIRGGEAKVSLAPKIPPRKLTLTTNPVSENSTPLPNPAVVASVPLMTAKPPLKKPTPAPPAPAVQSSDTSIPAPRIVAGRQLRPTDRFNECHLSYRVEPAYPAEAKQQRVEGTVKIHQVIGADGNVQSERLLSGPPLLAPAAMEAAKYWRYLPALLNGQPVETELDIEIDFRLPR